MSKNKNSHVNEQQDHRIKGNLRVNGQSLGESLCWCAFSRESFEMKTRMLAFFTISLLYVWETESAPVVAKPRQILPELPGYIPVYIRPGNTPLEDINLDLAEAFESYAFKQGRRIGSVRALSHNDVKDESDVSSLNLDNVSLESPGHDVSKSTKHDIIILTQIQKIPKISRT